MSIYYDILDIKNEFLSIQELEIFGINHKDVDHIIAHINISDHPRQTFRVFDPIEMSVLNPNVSDIFINGKDELIYFDFESKSIKNCPEHFRYEKFSGFFDSFKTPVFENDLICYAFLSKQNKILVWPACANYGGNRIFLKNNNVQIDAITNLPIFQNIHFIAGVIVGHCYKYIQYKNHKKIMLEKDFENCCKLLKTIIEQTLITLGEDD